MPTKKDPYASPAQKLLGLYGLLLFTGRAYSLPRLATLFRCSKQTVLRMMEQIELTHRIRIETWSEGHRKWYQVKTPAQKPNVTLDVEAIQHLMLCRDIVWHLLPKALRDEVSQTIAHATVLLPKYDDRASALTQFAQAQPKGLIDYSKSQTILDTLFHAMREHRICEITYQSNTASAPKTFAVAPVRFIAFRDGLYLKGRLEKALPDPKGYYDPLLAIQRLVSVKETRRTFKPFADPEEAPTNTFGLMPGPKFQVQVKVGPSAAAYVRERLWSGDQKIEYHADGGLTLVFTATSKPEVVSWVLSFGGEAELLEPAGLRNEIRSRLQKMLKDHGGLS